MAARNRSGSRRQGDTRRRANRDRGGRGGDELAFSVRFRGTYLRLLALALLAAAGGLALLRHFA